MSKNRCDCYHVVKTHEYRYDPLTRAPIPRTVEVGLCWGTKEQDRCSCNGDRCKCDFYDEVREKAKQQKQEETIPARISNLIVKLNKLDLQGTKNGELRRAEIVNELFEIKTIIERNNT